jgi:hypothetical protein
MVPVNDPPTSVHTLESNVPLRAYPGQACSLDYMTTSERWRHSGWQPYRNRVWRALISTGQSPSRLEAFASCGDRYRVYESVSEPGVFQTRANCCHDRFCLPCARTRSALVASRVLTKIHRTPSRFITLTYKTDNEPLKDSLNGLYASFSRLRRSSVWRDHVTGGVAFLELKYIEATKRWHPHLHCIVQGSYMPQDVLSRQWLMSSGYSYVVDIRYVRRESDVARYVTKYVSKTLDGSFVRDHELLCEAVDAVRGRRLALTFGSWRGYRLTTPEPSTGWELVGDLTAVLLLAEQGDRRFARALLSAPVGLVESLKVEARASPLDVQVRKHWLRSEPTLFPMAWH